MNKSSCLEPVTSCAADHVVRFTRPSPSVFAYRDFPSSCNRTYRQRLRACVEFKFETKDILIETMATARSSCEASRSSAYSVDLRWRIFWQRGYGGRCPISTYDKELRWFRQFFRSSFRWMGGDSWLHLPMF